MEAIKMMIKRTHFIILLGLITTSCFRLDDNLFNKKVLENYQLDAYTGEIDFKLPSSYNIPDSLIHKITFPSRSEGDNKDYKLYGVYIGDIASISSDTVILYCHGNKWHIDFYWERAKLMANSGYKNKYGVLVFDYRGYGMSEGKSDEESLYADADAALKWLQSNGASQDRIVMYGFSMGSFPTVELASNPRSTGVTKVILEAPYASANNMVEDATGMGVPGSYVTNLEIDNASKISSVSQPFMWLHGLQDGYCNIETEGRKVYNNYKGSYAEKHIIEDADHSNVPLRMGYEAYTEAIDKFITR
ncbi:MAG TPA: alpha/beta hydrolase [Cytophagaceae bacterium]|jgi:alpha/beta superfamily hydrolase